MIIIYYKNHELNANSVDPDQTPLSAALIWVYTVCQCPFYRVLDINANHNYSSHFYCVLYFLEKIRLVISYESSADSHEMPVSFSLKDNKINSRM